MTILLVAAALVAGAGAIAALAPADARVGLLGLTASLVGAALLSDPLPGPAILAVRLSAVLLSVVMLRAVAGGLTARETPANRGWSGHLLGSELGWPAEFLLGLAGAVAGLAVAAAIGSVLGAGGDVGQPPATGPADLLAAPSLELGLAGLLAALAVGPMLVERSGFRRAVAAVLAAQAAILVRAAFGNPGSALDEVVFAALLVTVAGAAAALVAATAGTEPGTRPSLGTGPAGRIAPAGASRASDPRRP